jgi:DNA-directed RNA polymerase I, II, and III subunit RPABC2
MSYFDNDNDKENGNFPHDSDDDTDDNESVVTSDDENNNENNLEEEEEEANLEEDADIEEDDDLEEEVDLDDGEGKGIDDDVEDPESADNDSDIEGDEDRHVTKKKGAKKILKKTVSSKPFIENLSDDEDEDGDGETYLKKFDKEINDNYIVNNHPECALQNYDEILAMTKVIRDKNYIIIDDLHKTIPYLTKYERARILGQRAKQIESGATPFIKVPENMIDGYLIAELELKQGRIPFIIRRPMPNGGSEYWKINDLENIAF